MGIAEQVAHRRPSYLSALRTKWPKNPLLHRRVGRRVSCRRLRRDLPRSRAGNCSRTTCVPGPLNHQSLPAYGVLEKAVLPGAHPPHAYLLLEHQPLHDYPLLFIDQNHQLVAIFPRRFSLGDNSPDGDVLDLDLFVKTVYLQPAKLVHLRVDHNLPRSTRSLRAASSSCSWMVRASSASRTLEGVRRPEMR